MPGRSQNGCLAGRVSGMGPNEEDQDIIIIIIIIIISIRTYYYFLPSISIPREV